MKTKHQYISLFLIAIMITHPLAQTYAACPGPPCPPPDCDAQHDAVAVARSQVEVFQEAVRSQREDVAEARMDLLEVGALEILAATGVFTAESNLDAGRLMWIYWI